MQVLLKDKLDWDSLKGFRVCTSPWSTRA